MDRYRHERRIIRGGDQADNIRISEMSASQTIYVETRGGADIANLLFVEAANFIGMDGGAGEDGLSVNRADSNVISFAPARAVVHSPHSAVKPWVTWG